MDTRITYTGTCFPCLIDIGNKIVSLSLFHHIEINCNAVSLYIISCVLVSFKIYSIARNKAGGAFAFVTSDEDRTVRYWQNGTNTQTFKLPAQSVWTVACLSNGDIVTGSRFSSVIIFITVQLIVSEFKRWSSANLHTR